MLNLFFIGTMVKIKFHFRFGRHKIQFPRETVHLLGLYLMAGLMKIGG